MESLEYCSYCKSYYSDLYDNGDNLIASKSCKCRKANVSNVKSLDEAFKILIKKGILKDEKSNFGSNQVSVSSSNNSKKFF